ncbi:MAG: methyltransferase domain-containing protein [archaeon]|jgi:2-polyprenyl-3-methyl-5-hydroxy-6-metoxy-1,4-benzoquinol methylase
MNNKQKESAVKELYEKYPYPSRDDPSEEDVKYFAKWVAKIFGENTTFWKDKTVLELGCGTGELACGLALCGASVTGIDFSSTSIKHATSLAKKLGVANKAKFIEKNILEITSDDFNRGKYDVCIALGSLHHTVAPRKGFEILSSKAKQNGLVIVGLYNKYSRARQRVRRVILRAFCGNDIEKRITFGEKYFGTNGNKSWAADKYGQIHESYHSILEVLKWFKEENLVFIASKPKFKMPIIDEIKWMMEKKEAFFVMVGKKEDKKRSGAKV